MQSPDRHGVLRMALLALAGTTLLFTQHGLGVGVDIVALRRPAAHHARTTAEESVRQ